METSSLHPSSPSFSLHPPCRPPFFHPSLFPLYLHLCSLLSSPLLNSSVCVLCVFLCCVPQVINPSQTFHLFLKILSACVMYMFVVCLCHGDSVEVRGHLQLSVLTFCLIQRWSFLVVYYCLCQASWPVTFGKFSGLCLPSHCRYRGITDACHYIQVSCGICFIYWAISPTPTSISKHLSFSVIWMSVWGIAYI